MNLFRKSPDLLIGIIVCLLTIGVVLVGMQNALRVLLALPFLFILPGYSLVAAIYGPRSLNIEVYIVFAVVLSLSLTAIGGLLLNFSAVGLNTQSWLLYLAVITLLASSVALIRRQRLSSLEMLNVRWSFNWMQIAMFGAAIVLVFVAIRTARIGVLAQPREGFTQLWMLPPTQNDSVQIGIQNEEGTPTSYRLVVKSGDDVLVEWDNVELQPGEEWQNQFTADGQADIEASLYRTFAPENVYRTVSLALNSELSPPA